MRSLLERGEIKVAPVTDAIGAEAAAAGHRGAAVHAHVVLLLCLVRTLVVGRGELPVVLGIEVLGELFPVGLGVGAQSDPVAEPPAEKGIPFCGVALQDAYAPDPDDVVGANG